MGIPASPTHMHTEQHGHTGPALGNGTVHTVTPGDGAWGRAHLALTDADNDADCIDDSQTIPHTTRQKTMATTLRLVATPVATSVGRLQPASSHTTSTVVLPPWQPETTPIDDKRHLTSSRTTLYTTNSQPYPTTTITAHEGTTQAATCRPAPTTTSSSPHRGRAHYARYTYYGCHSADKHTSTNHRCWEANGHCGTPTGRTHERH